MDIRWKTQCLIPVLTIGTGTVLAVIVWQWWNRRKQAQIPKHWTKIGEISELWFFPVKSLGSVEVSSLETSVLGPKYDCIKDRTLLVTDENGKFLTIRQYPKMVLINSTISDSALTFSAPGMESTVSIDVNKLSSNANLLATIWGQKIPAYDCGDEVATWLSLFLTRRESGLRMVYYPLEKPMRKIAYKNKIFHLIKQIDGGAFHDETSFALQNHASLCDLSERVGETISNRQLRANFVVKGPAPYDEDNWEWLKIGAVIFQNIRPCTRCLVTIVNPDTGEKHEKMEPLKTLRTYRKITDPKTKPFIGESPVMGIHLGIRGPNGTVHVGDPVYVNTSE